MGKVKRLNKKEKVVYSAPPKLAVGEESCQEGCVVRIKRVPEDIKKAKKLGFTIDSEHVIQKAPGRRRNCLQEVYLRGNDGELYSVGFPYTQLRGRFKDGTKVPGTRINQTKPAAVILEGKKKKDKKKKKK